MMVNAARTTTALFLATALTVVFAGPATAATYYVDTAGADTNAGTEAAPFKTIRHAAATASAGDVVIVRPGEYDEVVTVTTSGRKDRPITFRADPARKARMRGFVLEADYIHIEGFEISNPADGANGIFAGQAHRENARTGCRMIGNHIHDITGTAITSGTHAVVKNNTLRNVFRGMFVNSNTLVEDNEVDTLVPVFEEKNGKKKPKKTMYTFFSGDDITFRGNDLHGAPEEHLLGGMGVCFFASWDAWIFPSSHRILIENNRCFNATHASEPMGTAKKASSHITYRNNLFVNTVHVGVMPKGFTHVTVENNTFINCGAYPVWLQGDQCKTAVVRNNLIAYWKHDQPAKYGWHAAESGVRIDADENTGVCDYNLFFACKNREYGEHDFVAEPTFVDPANGDFRLKAGSPGIDAGTPIKAVTTDLRGAKRPQGDGWDVGAYEWTPTPPKDKQKGDDQ
ncbi:MAG: choice-of-anchor Q domain-containing protein [Planctomycetota bacterium]